jgi:hypothetical protein
VKTVKVLTREDAEVAAHQELSDPDTHMVVANDVGGYDVVRSDPRANKPDVILYRFKVGEMGRAERDLRFEIATDLLEIEWPGSLKSERAGPFLGLRIFAQWAGWCSQSAHDFRLICKLEDADIIIEYTGAEEEEDAHRVIALADPKYKEIFIETVKELWVRFMQLKQEGLRNDIANLQNDLEWYDAEYSACLEE